MLQSPPSRRRGLKLCVMLFLNAPVSVASFSEAWIEILFLPQQTFSTHVASFSEAWIEIVLLILLTPSDLRRLLLGGVD